MIKFFRKIRQNLLMENKTSKYFKYALGEIILVVIGILIALQINNWNEARKLNSKEKEIISLLLRDLKIEKERLLFYKGEINKYEQGIIKIVDALDTKKPIESVYLHVEQAISSYVYKPFKPIYEGIIQNNQLNIIQKQEIRDFLVNHFEETNNYLTTLINNHDELHKKAKSNLTYYFPQKYIKENVWNYTITKNAPNIYKDKKVTQSLGALGSVQNWLSFRIDTYFIVRSDSLSKSLKMYSKMLD